MYVLVGHLNELAKKKTCTKPILLDWHTLIPESFTICAIYHHIGWKEISDKCDGKFILRVWMRVRVITG